jgi:hypothetical protein
MVLAHRASASTSVQSSAAAFAADFAGVGAAVASSSIAAPVYFVGH